MFLVLTRKNSNLQQKSFDLASVTAARDEDGGDDIIVIKIPIEYVTCRPFIEGAYKVVS